MKNYFYKRGRKSVFDFFTNWYTDWHKVFRFEKKIIPLGKILSLKNLVNIYNEKFKFVKRIIPVQLEDERVREYRARETDDSKKGNWNFSSVLTSAFDAIFPSIE